MTYSCPGEGFVSGSPSRCVLAHLTCVRIALVDALVAFVALNSVSAASYAACNVCAC